MIKKLAIQGLYGRFAYNLNFKKPGGITIITGPNGYGKSTILRIIKALSDGDFDYILRLDFTQLRFNNEVGSGFQILKCNEGLEINGEMFDSACFINKKTIMKDFYKNYINIYNYAMLDHLEDEIKLSDKFVDIKNELYKSNYVDSKEFVEKTDRLHEVKNNIRKQIGSVKLIQEQRLIRINSKKTISENSSDKSENETINFVNELPKRFVKQFSDLAAQYSTVANKLDSSYPNRLFDTERGIMKDEYAIKVEEMQFKVRRLSKYSISELQTISSRDFKNEYAKALKVYFDDFDAKYSVYNGFIEKLDIFTTIINSRLRFKHIEISGKSGIVVVDDASPNGQLSLSDLSSGEKQEIVLFYELIFETPNSTLLLIDEPEISLHIAWQKMFMDDLIKIADYKGIKAIVATHSPQILNGHWENQIDLGELYES